MTHKDRLSPHLPAGITRLEICHLNYWYVQIKSERWRFSPSPVSIRIKTYSIFRASQWWWWGGGGYLTDSLNFPEQTQPDRLTLQPPPSPPPTSITAIFEGGENFKSWAESAAERPERRLVRLDYHARLQLLLLHFKKEKIWLRLLVLPIVERLYPHTSSRRSSENILQAPPFIFVHHVFRVCQRRV